MIVTTNIIVQGNLGKEIGVGCHVWYKWLYFICVQSPLSLQYVYFNVSIGMSGGSPVILHPLNKNDFVHQMSMSSYFRSVNAVYPDTPSDLS